ncbi:hypothetical protein LZ31DRAFT_150419 [Colletotrichum somersetense]|nr:hypothetical protein LZ31DRAFT_150419 [Colletotrichum somersetense]
MGLGCIAKHGSLYIFTPQKGTLHRQGTEQQKSILGQGHGLSPSGFHVEWSPLKGRATWERRTERRREVEPITAYGRMVSMAFLMTLRNETRLLGINLRPSRAWRRRTGGTVPTQVHLSILCDRCKVVVLKAPPGFLLLYTYSIVVVFCLKTNQFRD